MKRLIVLFWTMIIYSSVVVAQPISHAYVFGEKDSLSNVKCSISYDSSIAAVKSALRYNKVPIVNSAQDFCIYININNFEIDSKDCAVAVDLHFYFYSRSRMPNTSKSVLLKNMLCDTGTAGHLSKKDMQTSVNSALKDLVDQCLSKIENLVSN